jgi:hypothetical protein
VPGLTPQVVYPSFATSLYRFANQKRSVAVPLPRYVVQLLFLLNPFRSVSAVSFPSPSPAASLPIPRQPAADMPAGGSFMPSKFIGEPLGPAPAQGNRVLCQGNYSSAIEAELPAFQPAP